MRRGSTWVPALAAPIAVLVHIVSEALATGRGLVAVTWEPSHLALLVVALAAMPFWFRAAGARRLAQAMVAFVGLSLLADGGQIGLGALFAALFVSACFAWVAGFAIQRAADPPRSQPAWSLRPTPVTVRGVVPSGPYFAYVTVHGCRPPPLPRVAVL
jgi:hypothetical protein